MERYVGYAEVVEALGLSRRTIERQVRAGTFPQPQRLSKNRVGWPISVIESHLRVQTKRLQYTAVADTQKLAPEKIEQQAFEHLAARASASYSKFCSRQLQVAPEALSGILEKFTDPNQYYGAISGFNKAQLEARRFLQNAKEAEALSPAEAAACAVANFPQLVQILGPYACQEWLERAKSEKRRLIEEASDETT